MRKDWKREYFSIPNIMGYFRILLIPVFIFFYLRAETFTESLLAAGILGVSALTDLFDGKVARHFNQVTEFGKILDPVADKLSQAAAIFCLCTRYPALHAVVILFVIKELTMAVLGIIGLAIHKKPDGAQMYGKISTTIIDVLFVFMIIMPYDSYTLSLFLAIVCAVTLLYSLISYILFYIRMWSGYAVKLPLSRKQWRIIRYVLITAIIVYLVVGICVTILPQGSVSAETESSVDTASYYSDTTGADRAMIIADNEQALEERIRMIAQAEERILFSTFDIRADSAGIEVLAALLDAADRGVKVQMLVDGMRSWTNMEGNPYFYALSCHENVEIRIYNQMNLLKPWTIMGRLHDKYIVVDDDVYMLGGRNTFSYFLGEGEGKVNYDWDVLIWNDGSAKGSLSQIEDYFYGIWEQDCVTVYHDEAFLSNYRSVRRARTELEEIYDTLEAEQPELFSDYDYTAVTDETNQVTLLSNPTEIYTKEPTVFYTIMELAKDADEVDIHTPYIIANDWMLEELSEAAEACDLTIMTNSVANNGNPFGKTFYSQVKGDLIEAGIQLLEYDGGISYHGKVITMDERLSLVGSFNLDQRSVYIDTELMLVIDSEAFYESLNEEMAAYEASALIVVDEDESIVPDGMEAQEVTWVDDVVMTLIGTVLGWAKCMM